MDAGYCASMKQREDHVKYRCTRQLRLSTRTSCCIGHARIREVGEGGLEVRAEGRPGRPDACGNAVGCYEPHVPAIETNLAAIVSRVHDLTSGHEVIVVLLDNWSVWLGGSTRPPGRRLRHRGRPDDRPGERRDQVDPSRDAPAYVDLRAAFKGPDYTYDETHYLSNDGDHPNAAGHQQIAAATEAVIKNALHIPMS